MLPELFSGSQIERVNRVAALEDEDTVVLDQQYWRLIVSKTHVLPKAMSRSPDEFSCHAVKQCNILRRNPD